MSMLDSHSYPKGGLILHMLRRDLGDADFFRGLGYYLRKHAYQVVETHDLIRAFSEATGRNVEPFFEQWVFKPGHPVLDTTWTWDEAAKKVVLTVKQTQDTKDVTPIYSIAANTGMISGGMVVRVPVALSQAEQVFKLDAPTKPDAVLLDPDHDFLREIPNRHWAASELPAILKYAPSPVDRAEALATMLTGSPPEMSIQAAVEAVRADAGRNPVFDLTRLGELKREDLRPLFRAQIAHASPSRREQAIRALGLLPKSAEDTAVLTALIDDKEMYGVISAAVATLGAWDPKGNLPAIKKAAHMDSLREQVRTAAYVALANGRSEEGIGYLLEAVSGSAAPELRYAALEALGRVDAAEPRTREALRSALRDSDFQTIVAAANAVRERKDKELLPAMRDLKANPPASTVSHSWFAGFIDGIITDLTKT